MMPKKRTKKMNYLERTNELSLLLRRQSKSLINEQKKISFKLLKITTSAYDYYLTN